MTAWVDQLKEGLPEYAKDTKLNLDAVIKRSAIDPEQAEAVALAAAFATGNGKLITFISSNIANTTERDAALTAGSIMAQNNIWYPYVEMADDENLKGLPDTVEQLRDIGRIAAVITSVARVLNS